MFKIHKEEIEINGKKIILDTNRYFDILTSEGLNSAVRN